MGAFSFSDQELADKAIAAAQAAMDRDDRLFAYRLAVGNGSKNDTGHLLNLVLNGVDDVGWNLHSVAPYIDTVGPNNEVILLTFVQPMIV